MTVTRVFQLMSMYLKDVKVSSFSVIIFKTTIPVVCFVAIKEQEPLIVEQVTHAVGRNLSGMWKVFKAIIKLLFMIKY